MSSERANESTTAREYVEAWNRHGLKAYLGTGRAFWVASEGVGLARCPENCFDVPSGRETRSLLWRSRCVVASYVRLPDEAHPANAFLYVCASRDYNLERLAPRARRDARRALRAFRFEFLDPAALLANGARPYGDTRARAGLSDGSPEAFQGYTAFQSSLPGYRFVGAWSGSQLAAYMWIQMIDDWTAIGSYSSNEHLRSCPNDGLVNFALDYFRTQSCCREVIYGLSSIQETERTSTLDDFKKKVGFEARPVYRAFVFHPLVRPLVNPLTNWIVHGLLKLSPQNRRLRKAAGLLANVLGK